MGWIKKLRLGLAPNDGKGVGIRTTFKDIENNLNWLKEKLNVFNLIKIFKGKVSIDGNLGLGTTDPYERLMVDGRVVIFQSAKSNNPDCNGIDFFENKPYSNGDNWYGFRLNHDGELNGLFLSSISGKNKLTKIIVFKRNGYIGVGKENPSVKLDVDGNVKCVSLIQTSDKKFKDNIDIIDGEWALTIFKQLKFSLYDHELTNSREAGLIAQEVEKILPQAVHTDSVGHKAINYTYVDVICKSAIQYYINKQISND